jgi:dihydrolipoamide dehydrogenase
LSPVPPRLVVIGGGVIGLELVASKFNRLTRKGSVWRRLGSKVTVLEFADRLLPTIDGEVASELPPLTRPDARSASFHRVLVKQGMTFKFATKVTGATVRGDGVTLQIEGAKDGAKATVLCGGGGLIRKVEADAVLVSVGRRARTENLGLEGVGVKLDERKRIIVNERLQTSVSSIYAIGDCVAGPMLAHKAEEEGVAVAEEAAGRHGHVNYGAIPGVIYTHPEIATVGQTEEELKAAGVAFRKGTFPFMANSRARTNGWNFGEVF